MNVAVGFNGNGSTGLQAQTVAWSGCGDIVVDDDVVVGLQGDASRIDRGPQGRTGDGNVPSCGFSKTIVGQEIWSRRDRRGRRDRNIFRVEE